MARTVLGPLCCLMLAALTVAASVPPNLSQTLEAQRDLLTERPHDAAVHNDLGNLLILDGRIEEAESAYRRAIELDPANILARFNLGVLLQQTGRNRDALAEFSSLLEIDDRHGRAHYQVGVLLESRGQRRKALDHYARAFAFDRSLTFAKNNPHLLDNRLSTEALLLSDRYDGDSNADTPRLYGEPKRIVDLMLLEEEPEVEPQPVDEPERKAQQRQRGNRRGRAANPPERERAAAEVDEEDDEEDEEGADRRTLTNQDLDAGSSLGQVRTGPSRRRPAIGVTERTGRTRRDVTGRGTSGRSVRERADARRSTGSTRAQPSARTRSSSGPRYRPNSGSTGRLELKLLPLELFPEPQERLTDRSQERDDLTM